jgi:hypothetical protein
MNLCFSAKTRGIILSIIAGAALLTSIVYSERGVAADTPLVRIEIERDLPNEKQHIVREFHDLEDLLMWFEDKVEGKTCDPYVTSIKMYPYGKFENQPLK